VCSRNQDAFYHREVVLRSFATFSQLASIDGNTLRAPEGQQDDKADAFALAVCARLAAPAYEDDYEPLLGSPGKADLMSGGHGFDAGVAAPVAPAAGAASAAMLQSAASAVSAAMVRAVASTWAAATSP
jgi:hypothetical protein